MIINIYEENMRGSRSKKLINMYIKCIKRGRMPMYGIVKDNKIIGYIYKEEKKIQLNIEISFDDLEYINKYLKVRD